MKHSHLTLQKGFHGLSTLRWGFLHPRKRVPCDCYACLCQSEITEEKRRKPSSHSRSYFVPSIMQFSYSTLTLLLSVWGENKVTGSTLFVAAGSTGGSQVLAALHHDLGRGGGSTSSALASSAGNVYSRRDNMSLSWFAIWGTCCTRSGRYSAWPKSRENSLDIFNNALDLARSIPNTVRAAMLSLLTQSLALCPIQCPCQRRRAMSPHNASHACCPWEVPALTSKWSWSSWLMGMVKYSLKTPLTSKVAPMPYGLASQVMRTWGPSLR